MCADVILRFHVNYLCIYFCIWLLVLLNVHAISVVARGREMKKDSEGICVCVCPWLVLFVWETKQTHENRTAKAK